MSDTPPSQKSPRLRRRTPDDGTASGVPLGGVGAGGIEFGPDGYFRNITINNNRTPASRIPLAQNSFMALRAGSDRPYARILQLESPDIPPRTCPKAPPRLTKRQLPWRGLYPVANYAIKDPACPIQLVMSAFSPIIPFDYDASILPLVLFGVRCENAGTEPIAVSLLLNVENFSGRTASQNEILAGPGATVLALEEVPKVVISPERRTRAKDAEAEAPPPAPRHNGVEMGSPDAPPSSAHGHYCVAARPDGDIEVSAMPWDLASGVDESVLWEHFLKYGEIERATSESESVSAGAVCAKFTLQPGETKRVDFVFAWYCPRFDVGSVDQGNGYTNRLHNAVEVAKTGLRNVSYYYASVEGWRGRLKESSLPRWLNDTFINACHVLTTNSLYTREGRFGLVEGDTDGRAGALYMRKYHSLGSLLFFPRFEDQELNAFANADDLLREKRFPRNLGSGCLNSPDFKDVDLIQVDLVSEFVLSAFRNYSLNGNMARLKALVPRLREAMLLASGRDFDQDGLPEIATPTRTYDGILLQGLNVITSGTWIAALRAYIRIAEYTRQPDEAERYRGIVQRAAKSFEAYFWDEQRAYYRLAHEPRLPANQQPPQSSACHSAQLAGQWYADFLGLGTIHDRAHVARALDTLERYNERTFGLLSAVMPDGREVENPDGTPNSSRFAWPAYTTAHYACLQIQRGHVERGMRVLEKTYRNMLYRHDRTFNHPDKWDLSTDNAAEVKCVGRHVGALSIWYTLYALTGVDLNLAESSISIMPRMPRGIHTLQTLLFTPACLGWLRFQEDDPGTYRQRLQLSLDSPITLQRIELRVPLNVENVVVNCELPSGRFETTHAFQQDENARRLVITAKRPVIANTALSVEVVAIAPRPR